MANQKTFLLEYWSESVKHLDVGSHTPVSQDISLWAEIIGIVRQMDPGVHSFCQNVNVSLYIYYSGEEATTINMLL